MKYLFYHDILKYTQISQPLQFKTCYLNDILKSTFTCRVSTTYVYQTNLDTFLGVFKYFQKSEMECRQISLLMLSSFKCINYLLFLWKSSENQVF